MHEAILPRVTGRWPPLWHISVACHVSRCRLHILFYGNTQNYQLRNLNGICDTAAATSRHRTAGSSPAPGPSSGPTYILIPGLDPTLNSYISCSLSILTPNSTHFCWEASAKVSCFSREMPNRSATFSEVILEHRQQTVSAEPGGLGTGPRAAGRREPESPSVPQRQ